MEQRKVTYRTARFHRRVLANLVDFIVFALVFLGLFLAARGVVSSTPGFRQNEETLLTIRQESGLYHVEEGKSTDIVTYYAVGDFTAYIRMKGAEDAVDTFIHYVTVNVSAEAGAKVQKDYDEFRLDAKFVYKDTGEAYFIVDADKGIIRNPALNSKVKNQQYFDEVYTPFIDEHAQGYLVVLIPQYQELVRFETVMLVAVELPIGWVLAGILVYLVPPLILRRGKKTFGRWMYQIGVADMRLLSCSTPRFIARWSISFFAVMTLSIFTFGIPVIISFSLMAFSSKRQGLPDYMLGLFEVDLSDAKLFHSYDELNLSGYAEHKAPIDFRMERPD